MFRLHNLFESLLIKYPGRCLCSESKGQHLHNFNHNLHHGKSGTIIGERETRSSPSISSSDKGTSAKEDQYVDSLISKSISAGQIEDVYKALTHYALVKRYPTRKTFLKLARIASERSMLTNLDLVRSTLKEAFPKEFDWQMEYQHYYAEGLWKGGEHKKAIEIFESLFEKHPMRAKKLTDMLTFLARDIINRSLQEELSELVESVLRISKKGIQNPAGNVWLQCFLSDSGTVNLLSWTILDSCPGVEDFIITKTDRILVQAHEWKRSDILQRYIEALIQLNAKSEYTKTLSSLLDFQCEYENLSGAMETFKYAKNQQVLLKAESLSKFVDLLKKSGKLKVKDLS